MGVSLNRNSWHRKLQKYVLDKSDGSHEDTFNLCPYFWLTVFCVFAVPFVFLWRQFLAGGDFLAEKLSKSFVGTYMRKFDAWLISVEENYFNTFTGECLYKLRNGSERDWKLYTKWMDFMQEHQKTWRELGFKTVHDYRDHLINQALKKIHQKEQEERAKKRKMERILQIFGKVLATLFFMFVAFILYHVALLIYDNFNWVKVLEVLKALGVVLTVGFVLVFVIWTIGLFFKKFEVVTITLKQWVKYILWYPFKYTGKGIAEGFKFVWTFVKNTKDDYCPSIKWED